MGKVTRLKGDLEDVEGLLEIISVLKDVSVNRFFVFAQKKANYEQFLRILMKFFGMLGVVETNCPLVKNNHPGVDLLIVASDLSFMAQLNSKVINMAVKEYAKYPKANIILLGKKSAERCKRLDMNLDKVYSFADAPTRYDLALQIRGYLIDRIMTGKSGKVVVVYCWAKSFSILKPRVITLLPASELAGEEDAEDSGAGADGGNLPAKRKHQTSDFIQESTIDQTMGALADIWIHARLVEIISDLQLVEFAATAQQLESAIEGLSGEKKALVMSLRKASRDELNKAMREVFTSTSITKNKSE